MLSSAEAELNASAKTAQEGLGMKNMMDDLGENSSLSFRGDSSANDGIIKHAGVGKVETFVRPAAMVSGAGWTGKVVA